MINRESRKYFDDSRKAHQTGQLSNALSEATLEFQRSKTERESALVDSKGNPLFGTLSSDIGKLGTDIADRVARNITDTEVKNKFKQDFSRYVTNQQISSLNTARKQQIDYTRGSVQSGLDTLLTQGISDSVSNVGYYEIKGQELLDDALTSGAMSFQEYERESAKFSEALRVGSLQTVIESGSVEAADELLSKSSEALGISKRDKDNLTRTLQGKKNALQRQAEAAEREAQNQLKVTQTLLYNDLDMRIETGELTEDELIREQPNLDPVAYQKLEHRFEQQVIKKQEEAQILNNISDTIANGESTSAYSVEDVNTHYSRVVSAVEENTGERATFQQKAQVAVMYNGKVPQFSEELNGNIMHASPEAAGDAVLAYTYVRDMGDGPISGRSFTQEARDMAEYVEFLHEKAAMPLSEAVSQARDRFRDSTKQVVEERQVEFNKLPEFNSNNLLDTAREDLDLDGFLGFFDSGITDESALTYKQLVRDAYTKTGDLDGAKKIAKSSMNKTHGISTFNGNDVYMANPPEMLFPGVDMTRLRDQFNTEVSTMLPSAISDTSKVSIVSDNLTRGNFATLEDPETGNKVQVEIPSYAVTYPQKVNDVELVVPLVNPETGELVRWVPDTSSVISDTKNDIIEKDKKLRADTQKAAERAKIRMNFKLP